MKNVAYQPLWLIEMVDSNQEVDDMKLLTKNIPVDYEKGLFLTGIFTKAEQITLGQDIFNTSSLREIYLQAEEATYELLNRLVRNWQWVMMLNRLRQKIEG